MYRNVGAVFECEGVKLEVALEKEGGACYGCHVYENCAEVRDCIGDCIGEHRGDGNAVIFRKSSIFPKLNFTTNCKVIKDCMYKNNKTGDMYIVIEPSVIEATNSRGGEISVLYKKANSTDGKVFVREICEFVVKFTEVIDK